jgi:hypothetical protein
MLDRSLFKIQKAVLEIRYDPAYLLWDRAGIITEELRKLFPTLSRKQISPNQQVLKLTDDMVISVEIDKAHLVNYFPQKDLEKFRSACGKAFPVVIDKLERSNLIRIGFRIFFEKRFETNDETAVFVIDHLPAYKRSGKYFNIDGAIRDPDLSLRWEGETTGCLVRFQAMQAKLEVEVPAEFGNIDSINEEKKYVQLDVDYYAHASTPSARFDSSAVIENWFKLIKRDVGAFIDG